MENWKIGLLFFFILGLLLTFLVHNKMDIMTVVFRLLYKKYHNLKWPIMSNINHDPPVLNIAYPDQNIVYFVNSFESKDNATIQGEMPPNIYFWSLTLYGQNGAPFQWISDASFSSSSFKVNLNPKNENVFKEDGVFYMKSPAKGYYCVIQRVYMSFATPNPVNYLPDITGLKRELKPVSSDERMQYSNNIQNLLYKQFEKQVKGKTPSQIFPNVNVYEFFLPSKKQVDTAFPNPYGIYLVVFPQSKQVLKITGKLPEASKTNTFGIRFASFMASNLLYSSTDTSISVENMSIDSARNYVLFVAFKKQDAVQNGYDQTVPNHNLLLWNENNSFPVLIYRLVNTEKIPTGIFAIENEDYSVGGSQLKVIMGEDYPVTQNFN